MVKNVIAQYESISVLEQGEKNGNRTHQMCARKFSVRWGSVLCEVQRQQEILSSQDING